MSDRFLCVLAGYDNNTEDHLCALQRSLYDTGFSGMQTKGIPMHFTIGYADRAAEDDLIAQLKRIASQTSSFDVTFNHIGIFGGGRVLFIAPDVSHAMLDLKEAFGGSDNWTAHTTMLIDEPDTIRAALPILTDGFSAFRGRVTQLHLYEFQPPRHILTVQLEGAQTC